MVAEVVKKIPGATQTDFLRVRVRDSEMGADRGERYRARGRRARVLKLTLVEVNVELCTW